MRTTLRYAAYILIAATIAAFAYTAQCDTDDSTNCVWIAPLFGNGQGNSFIDVNGTAYYFGVGE